MNFLSTRQVARLLGITPARLTKALWDGRVDPPTKSPSGNYLWTIEDVERASWVLRRCSFEPPTEMISMIARGPIIA